jgi:hypothetical protein
MISYHKILLTDGRGNFIDKDGNETTDIRNAKNFRFALLRDLDKHDAHKKFRKMYEFKKFLFLLWHINVEESMFQPIDETNENEQTR